MLNKPAPGRNSQFTSVAPQPAVIQQQQTAKQAQQKQTHCNLHPQAPAGREEPRDGYGACTAVGFMGNPAFDCFRFMELAGNREMPRICVPAANPPYFNNVITRPIPPRRLVCLRPRSAATCGGEAFRLALALPWVLHALRLCC